MQNEVKQTWQFDQPSQEVWEYLTTPELLEQWLMKNDFKPIVGHESQFLTSSGKIHDCKVLVVQPFTKLSYTWRTKSAGDGNIESEVVWTLVPKGNGTELQLVHSGFTLMEDVNQHIQGWTMLGKKLGELLNAKGK